MASPPEFWLVSFLAVALGILATEIRKEKWGNIATLDYHEMLCLADFFVTGCFIFYFTMILNKILLTDYGKYTYFTTIMPMTMTIKTMCTFAVVINSYSTDIIIRFSCNPKHTVFLVWSIHNRQYIMFIF